MSIDNINYFLMTAGALSIIVGLVHSVLGELLIFKKLRNGSLVPTRPAPPLRQRNIRILWATWHLASVFGFAMGAILIHFASITEIPNIVIQSIALSMCSASILVCYATKAQHPGWIGLLLVAVLCWLA